MTPYLTNVDPGDEDLPLPSLTKVCLLCHGNGVLYRSTPVTNYMTSRFPCPTCKGQGRVAG
jgi:DnaJ-class molecular chaperone